MRRGVFFTVGLGIVFLMLGVASWAEDTEKVETPEPLKIGVVNLAKVFSEYQKRGDGRVKLMKEKKEKELELKKQEAKLKKLEQELEVLEGEEKLRKQAEHKEKRKSYQAYYEVNNTELLTRQCNLWKAIYNEIIDEVKRTAEREDYDIILKVDSDPVSGNSLEEIQLRVDIKKFLFHSPKVDLTDRIINVLNEKYKRAKASKEKGS